MQQAGPQQTSAGLTDEATAPSTEQRRRPPKE
jgi:hypothetical protein